MDETALARARDAGDAHQAAEGKAEIGTLQVVAAGAEELEPAAGAGGAPAAAGRVSGKGPSGGGAGGPCLPGRTLVEEASAFVAGAGSELHEQVRVSDQVEVVLDDEDGVAPVPEPLEGGRQAPGVASVEAGAGLVEDVEDPGESRPEGGHELQALQLPRRQGRRPAVEGEIPESEVDHHLHAAADDVQDVVGQGLLPGGYGDPGEPLGGLGEGAPLQIAEALAVDADGAGRSRQPGAPAPGARRAGPVPLKLLQPGPLGGVVDDRGSRVEPAAQAGERLAAGPGSLALPQTLHRRLRPLRERLRRVDPGAPAERLHRAPQPAMPEALPQHRQRRRRGLAGRQQALEGAARRQPGAAAVRAGAVGAVEAEEGGGDLGKGGAAGGAGRTHAVALLGAGGRIVETEAPLAELHRRLQGAAQPAPHPVPDGDAVDDHLRGPADEAGGLHLLQDQGLGSAADPPVAAALDLGDQLPGAGLRGRRLQGSGHHQPAALGPPRGALEDLVEGLGRHRLPAVQAVGPAHPGPQQTQVVGQSRDRRRRRARRRAAARLGDGQGRPQPVDALHPRRLQAPGEGGGGPLRGQQEPPPGLGVEGVEGEARLARSGDAGEGDEPAVGKVQVQGPQVVLAGAADLQLVLHRGPSPGRRRASSREARSWSSSESISNHGRSPVSTARRFPDRIRGPYAAVG